MLEQARDQPVDEVEVDRLNLRRKPGLRVGVQLLPEAQQVLLAVARQGRAQRAHPGRAQLNRYGGRCTPRSVTIALTYSAGVTSKAGL